MSASHPPGSLTERYPQALMNTFGRPRLPLASGKGARVRDTEGREYLDLFGGIAVNVLGHGHPRLVEAVTTQLGTLGHVSNLFATGPQVELAERLLAITGREGRVFLSNSGSEANEAALKLTRRTGRTRIVAAEGGFHGRTMGALSITHKPSFRAPFEPLPGGVTFVPFGDVEALRSAVDDDVAAVVLEPIQGEAGAVVPPEGYLAQARSITRDAGALLWLDEIQTGMGRTGDWFAGAVTDPVDGPDIVTVAKGLGGGIPIGATIAFGDAAFLFEVGDHGSTFGGNPVAAAAALAVIEVIVEDDLMSQARARGEQLRSFLSGAEGVTGVEGAGLILGAEVEIDSAALLSAGLQHGFLLHAASPSRLRFLPPLTITESDVDSFTTAWPSIVATARSSS